MLNMQRKALWIAEELGESADDILDVLIGTITKPKDFVDGVKRLSDDYDLQMEKNR